MRPIAGTLVQAAFLAFATTIATVGAVNARAVWSFLDQGPWQRVSDAVAATAASAATGRRSAATRPASGSRAEAASPVHVARLASRVASPRQLPTVPLATVAEQKSLTVVARPRCLASGGAERRLDDSTLVQTIAACTSVAALDSLEAQLHAAFPSDPALRRGARAIRRFEARRARLASSDIRNSARDADAVSPSAPRR